MEGSYDPILKKDMNIFRSLRESENGGSVQKPSYEKTSYETTNEGSIQPIIDKDMAIFRALHGLNEAEQVKIAKPPSATNPIEDKLVNPVSSTPTNKDKTEESLTLDTWLQLAFNESLYHSHGAFKRLVNKLTKKGNSKEDAVKIAASIGRKEYGQSKFQSMAQQGKEYHEKHEGMSFKEAFLEGLLDAVVEDVDTGIGGGMTQASAIGPFKRSVVGGGEEEKPDSMNAQERKELQDILMGDHQLLDNYKSFLSRAKDPQVKAHITREIDRRGHHLEMLKGVLDND